MPQMISLQIDNELMNEFDQLQQKLGFSSRSEALRESILFFIRSNQSQLPTKEHRIATLTLHHEVRDDLFEIYNDISEKYNHIIKGVNQYNLKTRVIKSLIVAGSSDEINDLFMKFNTSSNFKTTLTYIILPDASNSESKEQKESEKSNP